MPDDAEIVEKLKIRYKKEKRIRDYRPFHDTNQGANTDRRNRHIIDEERCAESLKTDLAAEKRRIEREVESTQIANKIADGETPTKSELAKIEKNPAVRLLVKQRLKERGYETHELYANVLADAYETSVSENEKITEFDKHQARKLVAQEIKDLEGLRAPTDKVDFGITPINLIVHPGVHMKTDGRTTEIYTTPETGNPARDAGQSENPPSGVWEKGR